MGRVTVGISEQEGRVSTVLLTLRRGGGGAPGGPGWAWHRHAAEAGHRQHQVSGAISAFLTQTSAEANVNRVHSSQGMSQTKMSLLKTTPFLPPKPAWDYRNECKNRDLWSYLSAQKILWRFSSHDRILSNTGLLC